MIQCNFSQEIEVEGLIIERSELLLGLKCLLLTNITFYHCVLLLLVILLLIHTH